MATILVVDDEPNSRQFLATLLGYDGHRVLEAGDGAKALELAQSDHPDLVISDLLMPGMDGYQLMRQLRAAPRLAETPIMYYSAVYRQEEVQLLAAIWPACHFLAKPADPQEILPRVRAILGLEPVSPKAAEIPADFEREHVRILTSALTRKVEELREALQVQDLANIMILDLDHRITRWTTGCQRVYGYSSEQVVGRISHELLHTRFPRAIEEIHAALLAQGRWEGELIQCRADGSCLVMASEWVLYRDTQGQPRAILEINNDITRRRQAEQQVEERERQLRVLNEELEDRVTKRTAEAEQRAQQLRVLASELLQAEERERRRLARLLHDHLQQMLVAAKMRAALAGKLTGGPEQQEELQHVMSLLDQSLDVSRNLTAELSPPVLYESGLIPALNWLARWMKEKHTLEVSIEADAQAEPASLEHKTLLFRATRELLFNTAKHSGVKQATVTLAYFAHPGIPEGLSLTVADRGRGFDPLIVSQGSPGGFGLFSLKERTELVGGQVIIDSRPEQGTRVTVIIPVKLMAAAPQATPRQPDLAVPAARHHPERVRVMLTDDHKLFREGLRSMLARESAIEVVGEASDGQEAVRQATALSPDVVLMDVSLPDISGVEATRRIIKQSPHVRVIALSMFEAGDMATAMRWAGAEAYLSKDGLAQELISAILGPSPACRGVA